MSKLNELIHKLRPDEVEYISIGSLITRIREKGSDDPNVRQVYVVSNTQGMVKAEEYRENTIHSEDTSNYTIVRENMIAYNPSRLNIGSIARLKYSEAGLVSPMYVVFSINSQKIMYEYFDHIIKSSYVASKINSLKEEGARFRFEFSRWDRIIIPVPPLPVQQEIVRILDKFTQLTAELTAELTARKQQYTYYRDTLLKLDNNAPSYMLKDVCLSIADGDHMPPPKADRGVPFITISNITENRQIDFSNVMYVPREYYDKLADKRKAKRDDILYTVVGSFGIPVHISNETEFVFQRHIAILRPNHEMIVPRYMYHIMQSTEFYKQADKAAKGAAQRTIGLNSLGNMTLPVPSIEEQEQIVAILDRFEAICNDLSAGLPAEIEARQKQYEYYRDKLLTFKEVSQC